MITIIDNFDGFGDEPRPVPFRFFGEHIQAVDELWIQSGADGFLTHNIVGYIIVEYK